METTEGTGISTQNKIMEGNEAKVHEINGTECVVEDVENDSDTYKKEISKLKTENFNLKKGVADLREKMELRKDINEYINDKQRRRIKVLQGDVVQLRNDKNKIKDTVMGLQENMTIVLTSCTKEIQEIVEKVVELMNAQMLKGQSEVIEDMKTMNQELNHRGETISHLKEAALLYEKKVKELNEQISEQSVTITRLNEELSALSKQSQKPATAHKETETHDSKETQDGDGLSTSTVSKAEESARLKDIEDSFEDRYYKLRTVAAKLKKRATELQQQLDAEKQKANTERNELIGKINHLTTTARTTQKLQQECDRLCDELESEKNKNKEVCKCLSETKESEQSLKLRLEEAQATIEAVKANLDAVVKERDVAVTTFKARESELEVTKKEKLAEELMRKEKVRELAELMDTLRDEQEKSAAALKSLEAAKMEARKQSVLSLEMQNYERSLEDLNTQLSSEKGRVTSLEAEVETAQDIRDSLQEQIKLLEERLTTEETRCKQINEQLAHTKSCLQSAETEVFEQSKKVSQLTEKLERERASAEAAALELATLSSAVQTSTDIMIKEKQALTQQVATLNSQLATVRDSLENSEEENERLRSEFEKYKVRAQNVLRQHQSAGISRAEKEAKEEAEKLRETVETYKNKLQSATLEVEKLQNELTSCCNEREATETRCVNLNIALAEKTNILERTISEHRSQKLNMDTLLQCYKSQLEEKEKSHQEEINKLKEEIDSLRKQKQEKPEEITVICDPVTAECSSPTPELVKSSSPLLERGDGEGSENTAGQYSPTGTPPQVSPKPLLPLDKLLESNEPPSDHVLIDVSELNVLRSEREKDKVRLRHLSALLSEAEQDAARKEQLINFLKKEIGRLERCIEREPHAQNTEYLKNIVFKFVTLDTGDDRLRLVPVMSTLLQLSPEESQKLTVIARGESETNGSWGSYFSSWR